MHRTTTFAKPAAAALCATTVLASATTADAASLFHYRFNEGANGDSVSTANDSSPNDLDSTDLSGVEYTDNTPGTTDAGDFALDASGDYDYIEVADASDLRPSGNFTLEAYVRPNSPYGGDSRTGHTIVTKKSAEEGSAINSYSLGYNQDDGIFYGSIDTSSSNSATGGFGVVSKEGYDGGKWYHLALVFDKNVSDTYDSLSFYVNHSLVDSLTGSNLGNVYYSTNDLVVGAANYSSYTDTYRRNFDGLIDEVRLSDEALGTDGFLASPQIVPSPTAAGLGLIGFGSLALRRRRRERG